MIDDAVILRFPKGVRLRDDPARGPLLLGPEVVLTLDPRAADVLSLIDGRTCVGGVVAALAERYDAPRAQIADDVRGFLAPLVARRFVEPAP